MPTPVDIAPARGKLGVLLVGLGAVSTTTIAGVLAIRKGFRQANRIAHADGHHPPRQAHRGPLAENQRCRAARRRSTICVFGGWDIFEDDCYAAARTAGVIEPALLDQVRPELEQIRPWPAVFDQRYVKRLDGPNVKKGKNKKDLAEQVVADIRKFKADNNLDRLVMVWCGSTEIFMTESPAHQTIESFERALEAERSGDSRRAWSTPTRRFAKAFRTRTPRRTSPPTFRRWSSSRRRPKSPLAGKDLKTGQTLIKTIIAPGLKARLLGVEGWYSTNILGNRDGEVLDDPESFKTKEESKKSVLDYILQPQLYPGSLRGPLPRRPDQLLSAARRQQGRLGQHRSGGLARLPDAAQDQLPLPRQHSGGADRPRRRAVPRPREARRHARHPGVAVVLLQEPDARAGPLS